MSVESVVLLVPKEEQVGIDHVHEQWRGGQHSENDQRRQKSGGYDPIPGYDNIVRGYGKRGATEWSHGMDE
jgi:hypothetical protein